MQSQGQPIAVADLRTGHTCTADVTDSAERILLAAGTSLTHDLIQRLTDRGVTHVQVSLADYTRLTRTRSTSLSGSPGVVPNHARRIDRAQEPLSASRADRFSAAVANALKLLDQIELHALDISSAAMAELCRIPTTIVEMLVEDSDQAILASRCNKHSKKLSSRCAQMSILASAVAMEMGLTDSDVEQVGLAGLLHDIGLFLLPLEMRDATRALDVAELESVRSHPKLAINLLREFGAVAEPVKLLIAQVHELPDGSGYPRGLKKHLLHPLTRILNAVEVFLALTAPGLGRPRIIPHDAVRVMLHQCRMGIIDSEVMRALINQLSLYPLGSRVLLEDQSEALTARRDGEQYDAPIVQLSGEPDSRFASTRRAGGKIVAPLVDPECEMRLERAAIEALPLDALIVW